MHIALKSTTKKEFDNVLSVAELVKLNKLNYSWYFYSNEAHLKVKKLYLEHSSQQK